MDKRTSARAERDRRIFELRDRGLSQRAIAATVGCTPGTVGRVLHPERAEEYRKRDHASYEARAEELRVYRRTAAARKAEYDRAYRAANADDIREYRGAYKEVHGDRKREQGRRYRAENAEKINERRRERYAANADELSVRRRAAYSDKDRERLRRYRQANLEAHRAVGARRKTRGLRGMDAIDRLLSVEYRKAIADDPCTYCGKPGEHDDHKLPLARGGTDHWWNLHRTCQECNQRKHTRTHEEFSRDNTFRRQDARKARTAPRKTSR